MTMLATFDYGSGAIVPPWNGANYPQINGVDQPQRFQTVLGIDIPGAGVFKPSSAMRVELRPYSASNPGTTSPADGDTVGSGSRAEVYGRNPSPWSTPYNLWPDPAGSERWYSYSVYVPSDFIADTGGTLWIDITQWKGYNGGSPPIALEVNRTNFRLGGTKGNGNLPNAGNIAGINPGNWTNFIIGIKLSPDPSIGWIEAWVNRQQVQPRYNIATMDYQSDGTTPDPIYNKQGIYRNPLWPVTHILYFSAFKIATSNLDFGIAVTPPTVTGLLDTFGTVL